MEEDDLHLPLSFLLSIMRYLYCAVLVLFIFSCKSKNENYIDIFNEIYFEKADGESISGIDSVIQLQFETYAGRYKSQIPLFRYISGNEYQFFIGIPVRTSLSDVLHPKEDSSAIVQNLQTDSLTYINRYIYRDSIYALETVKKMNSNFLYLLMLTKSKTIADSVYNNNEINKRLRETK